ncbi:hypothetical protein GBAR_LOCUS18441 [Geodia barretti]|uniref:Uncharacterized protein n=1 Tax=Geodia barretti TaxID=519541 RepID=A0AA35SQ26_GEOBA|nr:hypothetical protein GBAR_LOCUS18441 [Geodia barretti]
MWQMPREEWRLLCGPTERRRNPHTSSASLSLCPTSETESRCSNLLYWTPAEEREGFVKMCSSYLRSSTSLSESCGFSLKKKRFASLPSYCCSYCIYTYIGEGKSSGEGSYCNGQVNKIENLLCS